MLFRFRKMRAMDPMQVAMTGVRKGERYLQVFCSDAALTRGLATKTGLSGTAALATPDDTQARQAQKAADKAGVLIDIKITPATALTWEDGAFDMVVVDNTGGSGLENIVLTRPEAGVYTVIVEHWGSGEPTSDGARGIAAAPALSWMNFRRDRAFNAGAALIIFRFLRLTFDFLAGTPCDLSRPRYRSGSSARPAASAPRSG